MNARESLRLVPQVVRAAVSCTRDVVSGSGWVARWDPCGKDLATDAEVEAGLCRGHLLAAKRAKTAAGRIREWTAPRHRWLTNVRTGLVTCYYCGVTDLSDGTSGDMLYISEAPEGRVAETWLSGPEIRVFWRPSTTGGRMYRVAVLTAAGRRVLGEWDAQHGAAS